MYPNTSSNAPTLQQSYVPYFYQIGLQYVYRTPQDWQRKGQPDDHATTYDFSSDRAASRYLDHPQTVEQIIERGSFSIPKGDSVTAIITDKVHTSWLGLDDVIQQVQQRRAIYDQNLYQIELNKCAAINAIYRHEGYNGTGSASSKQPTPSTRRSRSSMKRNETNASPSGRTSHGCGPRCLKRRSCTSQLIENAPPWSR
ncbi:MAG: hypothetical protein JXQ75_08835 [Phycisphaerae bacterium]|nr:hypothetical protein [Phycisphaerae bacterium]